MKSEKKTSKKINEYFDEYLKKLKIISNKLNNYFSLHKKAVSIILVIIIVSPFALVIALNTYYNSRLQPFIKNFSDIENVEYRYSALILGAGLTEGNQPSQMLKDRLDVGKKLLIAGKVSKLILSGDNREVTHNEPQAMANYLIDQGIDSKRLVLDQAGRRTYDSCYRAKEIFGQSSIYVITQDFHIVRAVYTCRALGIDTIGITADQSSYQGVWGNVIRDYFGLVGAFWDVEIAKPTPVLGDKIDI